MKGAYVPEVQRCRMLYKVCTESVNGPTHALLYCSTLYEDFFSQNLQVDRRDLTLEI